MTTVQMTQRDNKANGLKVFQVSEGQFYVSSTEGKICYSVSINGTRSCSCGDFTANIQKDQNYLCKHLIAAINCNGNLQKVQLLHNEKPKLDERFIIRIKTKEFVLYAGLLDVAHQKGLLRMIVEPIQLPTKDNKMEAICKATIESKDGETFVELADANPTNVNRMVAEHILRVAATRAKARALRDYTNIGMTSLEELGDLDELSDEDSGKSKARGRREVIKNTAVGGAVQIKPEQTSTGVTADERRSIAGNEYKKETKTPEKKEATPAATDKGTAKAKITTEGAEPSPKREKNQKPSDTKGAEGQTKPSDAQIKAIEQLSRRRGYTVEQIEKMFTDKYQKPYIEINADEAKNFIRQLQQAA